MEDRLRENIAVGAITLETSPVARTCLRLGCLHYIVLCFVDSSVSDWVKCHTGRSLPIYHIFCFPNHILSVALDELLYYFLQGKVKSS